MSLSHAGRYTFENAKAEAAAALAAAADAAPDPEPAPEEAPPAPAFPPRAVRGRAGDGG